MKLKKIEIKNYKQLAHTELNLHDDLTILAGPNNSGKTSFFAPVQFSNEW